MKLNDAQKNLKYRITNIDTVDSKLRNNFFTMGFYPGEVIVLKKTAPFFKDPMLFEISNTQIALTRFEASMLDVEVHEETGK